MQLIIPPLEKSRGMSLIELLIATILSLMLILVVLNVGTVVIFNSDKIMAANKTVMALQRTASLISDDLRRAGYDADIGSSVNTSQNDNDFMESTMDVKIATVTGGSANNCILFAYDRDKNGAVLSGGDVSSNEHFGYRLRDNGDGNVIEVLTSDAYDCNSNSDVWKPITDPDTLNVSALSFDNSASPAVIVLAGGHTLSIRVIKVLITGHAANDSSSTATLVQSVRVRADYFAV